MVRVLARVIAGAAHMTYGAVDWAMRQSFVDSSDDESLGRQASIFGLSKTPASFASGPAVFTGDDGEVIEEGTVLVRSDGARYVTIGGDYEIASGEIEGLVQAELAGSAYSLSEDMVLSFESPISGVSGEAIVGEEVVDGADQETTEALRARLRARMAEPPMGGSVADYIAWAKQVAGVTRVWVTPLELGAGTVVIRFVRDGDVSLIPSGGEVTEVQDYIDTLKPAHAEVTVIAPTDAPQAFTIAVVPDTSAVRAAVTAELDDLFLRVAEPGGTVLLSSIRTAIGTAAGLTDYTLTVPSADATATTNQLRSRGTITWA
jgi:uncharacterized phage protein gp47/JayE